MRPQAVKVGADLEKQIVADALNRIAYGDDRYIVDAGVRKFWSDHPRTEVILRGYDPEENT